MSRIPKMMTQIRSSVGIGRSDVLICTDPKGIVGRFKGLAYSTVAHREGMYGLACSTGGPILGGSPLYIKSNLRVNEFRGPIHHGATNTAEDPYL
jgi:hypothetical protein